jgi:hypothetical protein
LESFQISLLWGAPLESLGSHSRRFMAHFLETTVKTLPPDDIPDFWHNATQLAQNHNFLLHGILGISALHLHQVQPDMGYLSVAQTYYMMATTAFRLENTNITQDNVFSVFRFAILVVVFHFGGLNEHARAENIA